MTQLFASYQTCSSVSPADPTCYIYNTENGLFLVIISGRGGRYFCCHVHLLTPLPLVIIHLTFKNLNYSPPQLAVALPWPSLCRVCLDGHVPRMLINYRLGRCWRSLPPCLLSTVMGSIVSSPSHAEGAQKCHRVSLKRFKDLTRPAKRTEPVREEDLKERTPLLGIREQYMFLFYFSIPISVFWTCNFSHIS